MCYVLLIYVYFVFFEVEKEEIKCMEFKNKFRKFLNKS